MEHGFLSEFRNPPTIISTAIAVLSIILGIIVSAYFYQKSVREAELSYSINQIEVFDQNSINNNNSIENINLHITDDKGDNISGNIYVAEVIIWNSGNDEIKMENVRVPFRLKLDGTPLYQKIHFSAATRNNVDRFSLSDTGEINWDHFDPKEGFKVRFLYAADHELKINLTGYAINLPDPVNKTRSKEDPPNKHIAIASISAMAIIALLVGVLPKRRFSIYREPIRRNYNNEENKIATLILSYSITYLPIANVLLLIFVFFYASYSLYIDFTYSGPPPL